MKYDGIFFDSGGTIFSFGAGPESADPDSRVVSTQAPERAATALRWLGHAVADDLVAQQLADLKSLPQTLGPFYTEERVVEALFARLGLEPRADEIVYVTGVFSGPRYRSWLFPGVAEVLTELHAAGLPLGRRGIPRFPYSHSSFFIPSIFVSPINNKEKADRLRVLVRG